jgi:HSP20 family molecular chaperone IbpA
MYEDPQDMFQEMDEMFARLFDRMQRGSGLGEPQVYGYKIVIQGGDGSLKPAQEELSLPSRAGSEPAAEVHRIDNDVMVVVELPGATAESVRLTPQNGQLTIDAEGCGNTYHSKTDLPPVDIASMQSTFKNGVLEVTFRTLSGNPESAGTGKD